MLTFVFMFVILIACVILMCIGSASDPYGTLVMISCTFLVVDAIAIIICAYTLITVKAEARAIYYEYKSTKSMIESLSGVDISALDPLLDKILNINSVIAEHQAFADNLWVNWWYSKAVGMLKPLTFDQDE